MIEAFWRSHRHGWSNVYQSGTRLTAFGFSDIFAPVRYEKMKALVRNIVRLLSWREIDSSHRLMTAMVAFLGILSFFFGEIVPAGGGFGWDGVLYANLARNLESIVRNGQLSNYYAQRILPSVIVRSILLLWGSSFSNRAIILGFEFYNLVLLLAASWVWKRLANHFALSLGGRWLGFCGLFMSFMCSKWIFYYPVLTDTTALVVGMLALLFYVERRQLPLLAVTSIGAFAWQVTSICGAMLLILPRVEYPPEVVSPVRRAYSITSAQISRFVKIAWILSLPLAVAGVVCCLRIGTVLNMGRLQRVVEGHGIQWLADKLVGWISRVFTGLPSLAGVAIALATLVGSVSFLRAGVASLRRTRPASAVYAIAALLIPWSVVRGLANASLPNANSFAMTLWYSLAPPNGKILLSLVTLAVYWGPVTLLLLLNWKSFCYQARKLGPGFVTVVGLALPLGLVTEPRFVTLAWPFFVLGAVLSLEGRPKGTAFRYAFAVLTVLYGQFWMKLNLAPWTGDDFANLSTFPKSMLFMHLGLWMGWSSYLVDLCAVALSVLWLRSTLHPVGNDLP
jgi:hypothetical protein